MDFWQSVVLGVVQGVSEFLPVSSSGHLAVLKRVFDVGDVPLLYDVVLHVATLIVVVVFFRRRVWSLVTAVGRWAGRLVRRPRPETTAGNATAVGRDPEQGAVPDDAAELRLAAVIIGATVVTMVVGLAIRSLDLHQNLTVIGVAFLVTAAVLIASSFAKVTTSYRNIGPKQAVVVGLAQGIAVVPGISRSGSTIAASLFSGVARDKAGEFSFLLSIPAILGALVLELPDLDALSGQIGVAALAGGVAAAMVAGFLSLNILVKIVKGGRLWVFSLYLAPLGLWTVFAL